MEKINTIGKTITGLSEEEYNMIIRALKARADKFRFMACESEDNLDFHNRMEISRAYTELAKFIEEQDK